MELLVNGERAEFPEGLTVSGLLERLRVQPGRVVVEVNLNMLKRAQHANTILHEGDHIEIVHFVGGG